VGALPARMRDELRQITVIQPTPFGQSKKVYEHYIGDPQRY
jgi:hypothetical protein